MRITQCYNSFQSITPLMSTTDLLLDFFECYNSYEPLYCVGYKWRSLGLLFFMSSSACCSSYLIRFKYTPQLVTMMYQHGMVLSILSRLL